MDGNARTGNPSLTADRIYDAGSQGCGEGPLIGIAGTLREMPPGTILEIRSTDQSVAADLSSWCRMTGHRFLGGGEDACKGRYFVQRNDS